MNNIETTQMPLNMKNGCNSANVVSTCDVGKMAWFISEPLKDGIFLEVVFESITLVDFGVGVSDGSSVMGYDVGDLVGSNGLALDLQQFDLGLCLLDLDKGEPSLDVVEHSVVFVGLDDGEDVHDANGELRVPPDFIINFNAGFSVLQDEDDLAVGECQLEVVSGLEGVLPDDDGEGQAFSKFVGSLVGSGSVDSSHLGKEPWSRGVNSLKVLLWSSGHWIFIKKYFINLII